MKCYTNPNWTSLQLFDSSKWKRVRFGDVVQNINETECDPAGASLERFVGLEHLEPGSLHVRSWGNVADGTTFTRRCRPGHVLFGKRRAYQRKVAVAEFDAVVSGDIYVLAPKDDRLLPELLPFICLSERFYEHAVGTSAGSLSPRTNWSSLAGFEFDLPPLDIQLRIAEVLWAVDEAVCRYEMLIDSLNRVIEGRRHRFFSDTARVKNQTVGELFEVQLGKKLIPKAKRGISPSPYIRNDNVRWESFSLDDVETMDFSPTEFEKYLLREGDLLVCEGRAVGRCAIWRGEVNNCCYQNTLHRLRPVNDSVTTEYMLEFMIWAKRQGIFIALTGASTIPHLTAVKLKEVQVPIVSRQEQGSYLKEINELKQVLKEIELTRQQINRLQSVLLHQLVDGAS